MDLSIVIPCYNCAETLHDTLDGIAKQQCEKEWEVVFSDNGSTDNSRAVALSFIDKIPTLRIVDSSAERGQPYALNNGIENARGKAVILCDSDDVPLEGWLATMGEALSEHSIVACRTDTELLRPPGSTVFQRANPQGKKLQKVAYPPYLYHAAGASLGIKKALHSQLSGFDPEFPCLHDTDFCFKAQMAGYKIFFVEKAVICYRLRQDCRSIFRQAKGYGEYNIRLSKKYRSTGEPPAHRWKRFTREIRKVIKFYFRKDKDCTKDNSLFCWRLGWTLGRLKGVLKYRFPPF